MVQSCSAQYCKERSKPGSRVSFHSFPQDVKLKDQWIQAVCKYNFKPQKHSKICSKHFSPDDYATNGWSSKKVLKKDAVPNIVIKFPIHEESKCNVIVEEYLPAVIDNMDQIATRIINEAKNNKIVDCDSQTFLKYKSNSFVEKVESSAHNRIIRSGNKILESCSSPNEENKISFPTQCINIKETDEPEDVLNSNVLNFLIHKKDVSNLKKEQNSMKRKNNYFNLENEHIEGERLLCREKELVELKLLSRAKQIKSLQQRNRRLMRRISKLNMLVENQPKPLKTEIKVDTQEVTNMLKPLTPTGRVIIREMMKTRKSKGYPAELKNFALTLNFYSPRSYLYVKKIFPTMLPHPRTLLKWS